jgi:hypothetical protein
MQFFAPLRALFEKKPQAPEPICWKQRWFCPRSRQYGEVSFSGPKTKTEVAMTCFIDHRNRCPCGFSMSEITIPLGGNNRALEILVPDWEAYTLLEHP